jgi:hypothetical protein
MAQMVRRSSAPAIAAVARIKGSTSTISVQDVTEKLTPSRRHAAYKRFTSGFVVTVLIEETFEAGSARHTGSLHELARSLSTARKIQWESA